MPKHLNHVTQPPIEQIRRFLDLSTGHLPASDRLFLEFSADPGKRDGIVAMAGTYGWFVYAHDDRCCEGISDVLWAIFLKARAWGATMSCSMPTAPSWKACPCSRKKKLNKKSVRNHPDRAACGEPFEVEDEVIDVTCSIGVAHEHAHDDWKSLIGRADKALYRAKAEGRDRIVVSIAEFRAGR